MPETILLTGAAGFIGSHLCERLLERGDRVVGMDDFCDFYPRSMKERNLEPARRSDQFTLHEGDIRDTAAVRAVFAEHAPTAVVHVAAMAGVRPSIAHPRRYASVNVDGTVNLLEAAAKHRVQRFVFASSSSVYGNNPSVPFSESDPVDEPISPYAATKKAGELLCHTFHHLHRLPIACLRFFTVFGPRQRPDLAIAKFIRAVADGQPIPVFGDGSMRRDYTYVADIVDGVLAALDQIDEHGYRVWNLGHDQPVSLSEMIATIEHVAGKRAITDRQPVPAGDVRQTWANIERARRELGYQPRTDFETGIRRQWQWMRAVGLIGLP